MPSMRLLLLTVGLAAMLPQLAQAKLYDDLGGESGIHGIVEHVVPRWLADPRVGPTFAEWGIRWGSVRQRQALAPGSQICCRSAVQRGLRR